jgi:hypothetical protein
MVKHVLLADVRQNSADAAAKSWATRIRRKTVLAVKAVLAPLALTKRFVP